MPRVIVTISPTGETVVKVEGVSGPDCEKITRELQHRLGRTVRDVKTAEYATATEGTRARVSA